MDLLHLRRIRAKGKDGEFRAFRQSRLSNSLGNAIFVLLGDGVLPLWLRGLVSVHD